MDEWQVDKSELEGKNWMNDLSSDSPYVKESFAGELSAFAPTPVESTDCEIIIDAMDAAMFDPHNVQHPSSMKWRPLAHITKFIWLWTRQRSQEPFTIRMSTFCGVCKLYLQGHCYQALVTFMAHLGSDLRKDLEKCIKSAQNKMLDTLGPVSQFVFMADYLNRLLILT
ncbi:Hypothetical predicted protein [Pelobates cultripes]|uniref:Uncharacterized protein n=1 Tax=Pelobates cultripes TaxID=61616 RepID=A0AAD1W0N8_PELCU|nr:Hypothetical predicted protein [Pelobates cultripes]